MKLINRKKALQNDSDRKSDSLEVRHFAEPKVAEDTSGNSGNVIAGSTLVYRSLVRPTVAFLTAFDDGSMTNGETWRLRSETTVIGRTAGDIVIPHDPDISGQHARINRREMDGEYVWGLTDLNSTNGTFMRIRRLVLRSGREFMLGGRRFTFSARSSISTRDQHREVNSPLQTRRQRLPNSREVVRLGPRLIDTSAASGHVEHLLTEQSCFIGRDAKRCRIHFAEDPFLDPVHAHIHLDERGRWVVEDHQSLNGLWLRTSHAPLDQDTMFLLGGQRFLFRLPGE